MFTGIIETLGTLSSIEREGDNVHFVVSSAISSSLKVDQSVSHDGVCLTVTALSGDSHRVTAIRETLDKTQLGLWAPGRSINLERCLRLSDRLDGHIVQGHVDAVGHCEDRRSENGSWRFRIRFPKNFAGLIVPKGSICVNGVSLTAIDPTDEHFEVAIIPYTFEHTNFHELQIGEPVNLEFDILGKYLARQLELRANSASPERR